MAPQWLNRQDTLVVQNCEMKLKTNLIADQLIMYTAAKSYSLPRPEVANNAVTIRPAFNFGMVEGPAILAFIKNDQVFYYPFYLKNLDSDFAEQRDYRSPKTVNPDSVLRHQQIVHWIDSNQNLKIPKGRVLFFEQELAVTGKSGFCEAISQEPATSFYSQPGTAKSLPIAVKSTKTGTQILIGPAKDKLGNIVADGTQIVVHYVQDSTAYQRYAVLYGGNVSIEVPEVFSLKNVYAEGAGVKSKIISRVNFKKP